MTIYDPFTTCPTIAVAFRDVDEGIAARLAEYHAIRSELAAVKAQLLRALADCATAKAESSHYRTYYTRTGW